MEYEICIGCGCEFSAEGTLRQGCTGGLCYACEQEQEQEATCAECGCKIIESPTWQHDGLCWDCEQVEEQEQATCAECGCEIVETPTWQHDGVCWDCS